jgi:hypothetical protein
MEEKQKISAVTREVFYRKVVKNIALATVLFVFALSLGVLGYHHFCRLPWIDSLLNASMILAGMGPVDAIQNNAGKLFASFYAIFSGVAFLSLMALILGPMVHRFLHKFHMDEEND